MALLWGQLTRPQSICIFYGSRFCCILSRTTYLIIASSPDRCILSKIIRIFAFHAEQYGWLHLFWNDSDCFISSNCYILSGSLHFVQIVAAHSKQQTEINLVKLIHVDLSTEAMKEKEDEKNYSNYFDYSMQRRFEITFRKCGFFFFLSVLPPSPPAS